MKKILIVAAVVASVLTANSFAASIGRSGGSSHSSSSHSSSSVSRSSSVGSHSAPSKPSVAPAPNRTGGIGGTSSSVGVRKSDVTNGVRQDIAVSKGATSGSHSSTTSAPHYTPTPSYGYAPAPQPQVTNGSTFMSSLGGSFLGSWIGSSIGHSSHGGGTTVINNGTPSGVVSSGPGVVSGNDAQFNPGGVNVQPKKEYGVWNFVLDVIGFVFLVAILGMIVFIGYLSFKKIRDYVNKERGVSNIPFQPIPKFWEIQKAFAAADVNALQNLLGPDVVDELTNGLTASTLTLKNVSHEVRLANKNEFSIWYKFEDDGAEVNQVWHYEKFGGGLWKLNGIENV